MPKVDPSNLLLLQELRKISGLLEELIKQTKTPGQHPGR
jgi:hypothetical protein